MLGYVTSLFHEAVPVLLCARWVTARSWPRSPSASASKPGSTHSHVFIISNLFGNFLLKKRKKQQLSAQTFVMVLDFTEFPTCFDFDHFPTVSWILFFLHDFSHLSCNCFLLCFGNCLSLCVFLCLDFLSLSSLWLPDDVLSSSAWHPSFVTVSLTIIWSNLVSFYNQLSVYIKSYIDHLYPPNVFQRLQRLYPTILENICYSSQKKVAINLHLDQMRFVVINKLQV